MQKLLVKLSDPKTEITRFGRIKTRLWNFILPPHLRLTFYDDAPLNKEYNLPLPENDAVVEASGTQQWEPGQKGGSIIVEPKLMAKFRRDGL